VSGILKAVRRGRLQDAAAAAALEDLFSLSLKPVSGPGETADVLLRAYSVARELDRSVYDAVFLVVSRSLSAPLITADRSLYTASSRAFDVLWLGDAPFP
jgi:predicted nucleic acid-binding protein